MKYYENVRQISDFLLEHDIKPSFQRVKILERLSYFEDHPTVNEIYTDLVADIPSLSKTTVYNTLNLFVKHGVARTVGVDITEARYDLITHFHGHFICSECGSISDLELNDMVNFDFLKDDGREITGIDLTVRGICEKCKAKKINN